MFVPKVRPTREPRPRGSPETDALPFSVSGCLQRPGSANSLRVSRTLGEPSHAYSWTPSQCGMYPRESAGRCVITCAGPTESLQEIQSLAPGPLMDRPPSRRRPGPAVLPSDTESSTKTSATLETVLSPRFTDVSTGSHFNLERRLAELENALAKDRGETQQLRRAVDQLREDIRYLWERKADQLQSQLQEAVAVVRHELQRAVSCIASLNTALIQRRDKTIPTRSDKGCQTPTVRTSSDVPLIAERPFPRQPADPLLEAPPSVSWRPLTTDMWAIRSSLPLAV